MCQNYNLINTQNSKIPYYDWENDAIRFPIN